MAILGYLTMPKIVYAIYVNTGVIGTCLDAIRLLASPSAKRFSHLTVRGPYDSPMDEQAIADLNQKLEPNGIFIVGAGNFFDGGQNQNTVFFKCHGNSLKHVWDKKNYDFEPHVTVYDGPDRKFAESVYGIMSKYQYNVRCGADTLVAFEIGNGKNGNLASQIKSHELPVELDLPESFAAAVAEMPTEQRLEYIDRICSYLSKNSMSGSD